MSAAKLCSLIGNIFNGIFLALSFLGVLTSLISLGMDSTFFFGVLFLGAIVLNFFGWLSFIRFTDKNEAFWRLVMLITGIFSLGNLPAGLLLIIASQIQKKKGKIKMLKSDELQEEDWGNF